MEKQYVSVTFRILPEQLKFVKKISKQYKGDSSTFRAILADFMKNYKPNKK